MKGFGCQAALCECLQGTDSPSALYSLPLLLDSCTLDVLLCPSELCNSSAAAEDTRAEFIPCHTALLSEAPS